MITCKALLGEVLLCFYVCEMGVFGCEWSGAICMGLMCSILQCRQYNMAVRSSSYVSYWADVFGALTVACSLSRLNVEKLQATRAGTYVQVYGY